jgi:hypothetical protein
MAGQLVQTIVPVYRDFYATFSEVNFSKKHMEDYLRYTPTDVDRILHNFFGRGS